MDNKQAFSEIPAYTYGQLIPKLFSCGTGKKDAAEEESFMQIIEQTSEEDFLAYCKLLEKEGFVPSFKRDDASGFYREYKAADFLIYTYFTKHEKRVRIIKDNASVPLSDFSANDFPVLTKDSALMQFGLYYSEMTVGHSCNCGMLYAIRLRNNSLLIIDGGETEQATEEAVNEFMIRVRALCGKSENDEINVAAWFCTHPHNDHFDFFCKLLRKYSPLLKIERIMFNFCSKTQINKDDSLLLLRERLSTYCADALYIKPHTGQHFNIYNAEIDVLTTHEDILPDVFKDTRYYRGANETCTLIKISFEDMSLILLADAEDKNGDILYKRYSHSGLSCNFLQAAHHCINAVENIYSFIKADYVLIPQCRFIMYRDFKKNYELICNYYGEKNVFPAGDCTRIFRINKARLSEELYPVAGYVYDGSDC